MTMTKSLLFVLLFNLSLFAVPSMAQQSLDSLSEVDMDEVLKAPRLTWGHNPFLMKPGFTASSALDEDPVLSAIIFGGSQPLAIIDGEAASKGKVLRQGQVIVDIGRNYVLLESGDSLRQLTLDGASSVQPPHSLELKRVVDKTPEPAKPAIRAPAQQGPKQKDDDKNDH